MNAFHTISLTLCVSLLSAQGVFAQETSVQTNPTTSSKPINKQEIPAISTKKLAKLYKAQAVKIVDFRAKEDFAKLFIPKTQFLGANGPYKNFITQLIPHKEEPFVVIVMKEQQQQVLDALQEAGYKAIKGVWTPDFGKWIASGNPVDSIAEITADQLVNAEQSTQVLDVRNPSEYEKGHFAAAVNKPLSQLLGDASSLDPKESYRLYCQSGYRSLVVTSHLKSLGFEKIENVQGGYIAISTAQKKKEEAK
ncbi:hypothetical protein J5U18_08390 [Sphingobacteriaceae bacterium WQ 2009]|uniref:Rhodanese domain-containing protein n=1 Tax=Rhinopithecimicrobium faecis TaxID=2820698 RepID=A0A8T4HDZ6_9SPHI|nr:hypothetical protein [Sphingobacteriaceae bacterium WQ 2009]